MPKALAELPKQCPLELLIPKYLDSDFVGRAPNTIAHAHLYLGIMEEFTGKRPLDVAWYADWLAYCSKRWPSSTMRLALTHTDRFLRWLESWGELAKSPHRLIQKPPVPPVKEKGPITPAEYSALKAVTKGEVLEFAVILGWAEGMRLSDVCLLRWDAVDMPNGMIRVIQHKTRRFGEVALVPFQPGSHLYHALAARRPKSQDESWPNVPAERIFYVDQTLAALYKRQQADGSQGLQRLFKLACQKAGVKDKTFHSFRVAMCTLLANGNINTVLACAITGHRDPRIFNRYVRPDPGSLREAMGRLVRP